MSKRIRPEETNIGRFVNQDGELVGDEASDRVISLTETYLTKLRESPDRWDVLFQDPEDGRLWQLVYREGAQHGGGPPSLLWMTRDEAEAKYGALPDGAF